MLVDVPIRVHIPPSIVAYDNGMRNFEAGRPNFSDQRLIIGAKIITTAVLFSIIEKREIMGNICAISTPTLRLFSGSIYLSINDNDPDCRTPSPIKKSIAIVIISRLENPAKSSSGVMTPITIKTIAPAKSVKPGRILSNAKISKIPTMPRITINASLEIILDVIKLFCYEEWVEQRLFVVLQQLAIIRAHQHTTRRTKYSISCRCVPLHRWSITRVDIR